MKKASRGRKGKKRAVLLLMFIAAVIATSGCSAGAGPATVQLEPRPVKTELIKKQTIGAPIEQVAEVKAGTTLDVVAKANGEVMNVLKKRGDYVEKGDVLFVIDSKEAEISKRKSEVALQNAQEALKKAKDDKAINHQSLQDEVTRAQTALQNAQQDYNKLRNDFDSGVITQHEVDQAKQAVDNAAMNLQSAQNKLNANDNSNSLASYETQLQTAQLTLDEAAMSLENYSVEAPGSGVLTDFNVVAGQVVSSSSGKIGQVQQIDPIKVTAELSENNVQLVRGKQELVYYDPDTPSVKGTAKISYLAPIMSAATKTYSLELEIPNTNRQLQPGKRFMVQLTTEAEEQVIAVPTLSVIREDSDAYVFVQQGNQYQKRKVSLGRINGEYQEVLTGVKDGEQLVVTGQHTLKDGQQAEPAAPATNAK
ncbi:efflux RND transporter periplasmic adaptor subunit [Paenibacillus vulneris]|uniref:Efflux RND transporter periplasmic adaptor subunit n=1 Tax=Paenibacillus vulneris TaxID=1133364 RepID=A0ABW3UFI4_9BACL